MCNITKLKDKFYETFPKQKKVKFFFLDTNVPIATTKDHEGTATYEFNLDRWICTGFDFN